MNVAIVGTGYVGLVTGVCLAALGHDIICLDLSADRVKSVNEGQSPFYEPGLPELLAQELSSGRFSASTDIAAAVAKSDVTMIAVGTPSGEAGIDLRQIEAATRAVGRGIAGLDRYHVIAIKSTVVPSTTSAFVSRLIEQESGLGPDEFGLCMVPEFLREGSAIADFMATDRIVIGATAARSAKVIEELFAGLNAPVLICTPSEAECIKYATNALLATLISFSNEIWHICETLPDADAEVVMCGLHLDRRLSVLGSHGRREPPGILEYIRGGIGFGGSCLPKDVAAISCFATSQGATLPVISASLETNRRRPAEIVELIERELGAVAGMQIALVGLAFKAMTDDIRESPALRLAEELRARGATISGYDPLAGEVVCDLYPWISVAETLVAALEGAHAAVICTGCPEFGDADWDALTEVMAHPYVLDSRRAIAHTPEPASYIYRRVGQGPRRKT